MLNVVVDGAVVDAGKSERFATLSAGAAGAAVVLPPFVAGIGFGVVDAQPLAVACNFGFVDIAVGRTHLNALVGARLHSRRHGIHEIGSAVGIDGVVAGVVGNHHPLESVAFGYATSNGKHNTIAKRHHGGFHIFIVVVAIGDIVGSAEERAFEVAGHKFERNNDMLNAQALAVGDSANAFAAVLRRAIIECDGEGNAFAKLIEHGGGIHTT